MYLQCQTLQSITTNDTLAIALQQYLKIVMEMLSNLPVLSPGPKQEPCHQRQRWVQSLIQSWCTQSHQPWWTSQHSLHLVTQGLKYFVTKSWHILTYPIAISKMSLNISYLLCSSQGVMLTRVTVSPWHLSRPASHSVMVWRAAEPLTSAQISMPPSSHSPSSSQTQVLDCANQKHRGKALRMSFDSTKKTRIKCFEQNCRTESNFLEGSQLKKGTDPLKQRRVTKMIRNTSVIRTGWESWWCSAWRREGSVKNLRWPFGTQSWQQTF